MEHPGSRQLLPVSTFHHHDRNEVQGQTDVSENYDMQSKYVQVSFEIIITCLHFVVCLSVIAFI